MTDKRACLVLMLKAPERSKQRLAQQIGPLARDAAERLAECALEDTSGWPGPVCFAPAGEDDARWLAARGAAAGVVVVQPLGNLGQRINHINDALWTRGLERQIFIGMDCPEIDMNYLQHAAQRLEDHDAVLGPARDGGVVLMASRRRWPDLAPLPWSTPALMQALDALCRADAWSLAVPDTLADVDSLDDLSRLAPALEHDARPARRALAEWLRRHRAALEARQ